MVESLSFGSLEATGDWNQQLCINQIVVNLLCEGEGKYQRDRNEPKVSTFYSHSTVKILKFIVKRLQLYQFLR